jgi:hypothetical protein
MPSSVEERVQNGVAFLDEHFPGWWDKIDLVKLDIDNSYNCVLTQASGIDFYGHAAERFVYSDPTVPDEIELGFMPDGTDRTGYYEYDPDGHQKKVLKDCRALNQEWTRVILAKREALLS